MRFMRGGPQQIAETGPPVARGTFRRLAANCPAQVLQLRKTVQHGNRQATNNFEHHWFSVRFKLEQLVPNCFNLPRPLPQQPMQPMQLAFDPPIRGGSA